MIHNPQVYLTNQWREGDLTFLLLGKPYDIDATTVHVVHKGQRMSSAEYAVLKHGNSALLEKGHKTRSKSIERYRVAMEGNGWMDTESIASLVGVHKPSAYKALTTTLHPLYVDCKAEGIKLWRWR
jgi:hypothetical protein